MKLGYEIGAELFDADLHLAPRGSLYYLVGAFFAESSDHFLLPNSRCRVAALTKILLFGAIAHHAGMSNLCSLLCAFRSSGFFRHAKYFVRGTAALNPAILALPHRKRNLDRRSAKADVSVDLRRARLPRWRRARRGCCRRSGPSPERASLPGRIPRMLHSSHCRGRIVRAAR